MSRAAACGLSERAVNRIYLDEPGFGTGYAFERYPLWRGHITGSEDGKTPRTAENRKPYVRTAVFGGVSLAAYLFIFTRQDIVTGLFTMGGWHAVFPVGTALFFSFVHGAFASNLLNVMSLEARK